MVLFQLLFDVPDPPKPPIGMAMSLKKGGGGSS
jgi:hypothetical protein